MQLSGGSALMMQDERATFIDQNPPGTIRECSRHLACRDPQLATITDVPNGQQSFKAAGPASGYQFDWGGSIDGIC